MYHMFSSLEHMEAVGRPVAGINRIVGVGDNPRGGIADIPVMNIRTSLHLYGSCPPWSACRIFLQNTLAQTVKGAGPLNFHRSQVRTAAGLLNIS